MNKWHWNLQIRIACLYKDRICGHQQHITGNETSPRCHRKWHVAENLMAGSKVCTPNTPGKWRPIMHNCTHDMNHTKWSTFWALCTLWRTHECRTHPTQHAIRTNFVLLLFANLALPPPQINRPPSHKPSATVASTVVAVAGPPEPHSATVVKTNKNEQPATCPNQQTRQHHGNRPTPNGHTHPNPHTTATPTQIRTQRNKP